MQQIQDIMDNHKQQKREALYKYKKQKALIWHLIFSAVLLLFLFGVEIGEPLSQAFIPLIIIWVKFYFDYEKIRLKIEILNELQDEKNVATLKT